MQQNSVRHNSLSLQRLSRENDAQLFVKNWWLAACFPGGDQGAAFSIIPNPGSSDTKHLHHASCLTRKEIYILYLRCTGRKVSHICPDPQGQPPLVCLQKSLVVTSPRQLMTSLYIWGKIEGCYIVFPEAEQRNYERLGLIRLFSSPNTLTLGINWLILPF